MVYHSNDCYECGLYEIIVIKVDPYGESQESNHFIDWIQVLCFID